jgi:hypothetical protein
VAPAKTTSGFTSVENPEPRVSGSNWCGSVRLFHFQIKFFHRIRIREFLRARSEIRKKIMPDMDLHGKKAPDPDPTLVLKTPRKCTQICYFWPYCTL